jgi:hypothetical protein
MYFYVDWWMAWPPFTATSQPTLTYSTARASERWLYPTDTVSPSWMPTHSVVHWHTG